MQTAELIVFSEQQITAYDEFRAQLGQLKKDNSKAVFDYEDPKGNKEARSHIYKLRQTKSAVDKVRKEQKQASLDYGRRVDEQAKEIVKEIDGMIEVHQKPLDEIEQREKDRVQAHEDKLRVLYEYGDMFDSDYTAEELEKALSDLHKLEPDESFEEFTAKALATYKTSVAAIENLLSKRKEYEAQQAELEKLRKEKEEKERAEREALIAAEAAAKAKAEAELAAQREREAAAKEKMEAELLAQRERDAAARREEELKRQAEESERKAKQAIIDAENKLAAEKKQAEEAAKKREADVKHRARINNAAKEALIHAGLSAADAETAIVAIAKGKVPSVSIAY